DYPVAISCLTTRGHKLRFARHAHAWWIVLSLRDARFVSAYAPSRMYYACSQMRHSPPTTLARRFIGSVTLERKRDPSAKKEVDYRAEHRYAVEYPHLERHNWPKKKALRNQTYRRRLQRSLDHALSEDGKPLEEISTEPVRRVKSKRWSSAIPLG